MPSRLSSTLGALLAALLVAACADDPQVVAEDGGIPPPKHCGDGVRDADEACDSDDFGDATCRSFGAFRGRLRCATDCSAILTDGCEPGDGVEPVETVCGDGIIEGDEECDTLPPEVDCAAIGLGEGDVGCSVDCRLMTEACCQRGDEVCNGRDDDCDRMIDEAGCAEGDFCVEGRCQPQCPPPTPERCNGTDDDCDLQADEGFATGEMCTVGRGRCAATGVTRCDDSGGVECDARGLAPRAEVCDGVDDDCDGATDEDASCGANALCDAGRCVPASCRTLGALRAGQRLNGDTRAGQSSVQGRCGGGGPEVAYRVAAGTRLCVDSTGSATDVTLHLRVDCEDAATEVDCATGGAAALELGPLGGDAVLFVDSPGGGGPFTLDVTEGACPEPCDPVDRCVAAVPERIDPQPDQRAPANDEGQVLSLAVGAIDGCGRIELRASKRDGSDLGPGEYTLRVGDCQFFGAVRGRETLRSPARELIFTTDFRGELGETKPFCVTKAADSDDPDPHIQAWWFSNFARVTRALTPCP